MTVNVMGYGGKYLVCGAVSSSHCSLDGESVIDLSRKSHMVVQGQSGSARVEVGSAEGCCGYICILDSEPVEMTVFDADDAALFRLSEHVSEVVYKHLDPDVDM
jgi:hypothetical protein